MACAVCAQTHWVTAAAPPATEQVCEDCVEQDGWLTVWTHGMAPQWGLLRG